MSLLEVLSSRVAAPMVSKDLNMGIRYFPLIYFSVYFYFKVPMVEHGSDACPMVVCSISVRFKLNPLLAPLLMEEEISLRGLIRYWCASGGM